MIKKIINFCKQKYNILIPVMVVFVLLVTVYFLYREYRYDNFRNKQEVSVFQYFGGMKNEYTAIVTYNLNDAIVDLTAKDKKIEYDATPVYYTDDDKVLFPKEMNIVFPLKEGSQYKLYKYALYEKEDNLHKITVDTDTDEYNYFFLYDGKGLFFFPEEVELKINGKVYKELSAMYYVSEVVGYTLTYYDRESDTSEVIELDRDTVVVTGENLEVNISERYCLTFGKKVLLVNPYNLNAVSKTD